MVRHIKFLPAHTADVFLQLAKKDVYWDESLDFACVECPECEEKIAANKHAR